MLKALQQAAWIAAFAFVVAFWVLMATRASMSPDTNEQKQHQHEPKKSNNPSNPNADEGGQHYRDTWTKIKQSAQEYWAQFVDHVERRNAVYVALSGIAVAAFTLALFFATWLLWFGGERHSERELRAYVAIAGGNIRVANITQGGQGFQIVIELKNSGQTPGYDFTTWIKPPQILDKEALPFGPPTPISERTGASIIGPGAPATITWILAASQTEIADVLAETKKIFIWGGADYRDIFGKPRFFIFRDINGPFLQGIGNPAGLQPHKAGYDAN